MVTMNVNDDTTNRPLTSFTLFPLLPAEIRLEIWRASCTPRVVNLRYDSSTHRCHTTTAPPALLSVNAEAREEGKQVYSRAFQPNDHHPNRDPASSQRYIYFHPALDILYLPRTGPMGYDDAARDFSINVPDAARLVRSLAVDHVSPEVIRPWEPYNKLSLIRSFPHLEAAFLVISTGETPEERGGGRDEWLRGGRRGRGVEIEFVDPRGSPADVARLIDGVLESFYFELGFGEGGFGKEEEERVWMELGVELIPKAKVLHGWQSGHSSPIRCN